MNRSKSVPLAYFPADLSFFKYTHPSLFILKSNSDLFLLLILENTIKALNIWFYSFVQEEILSSHSIDYHYRLS